MTLKSYVSCHKKYHFYYLKTKLSRLSLAMRKNCCGHFDREPSVRFRKGWATPDFRLSRFPAILLTSDFYSEISIKSKFSLHRRTQIMFEFRKPKMFKILRIFEQLYMINKLNKLLILIKRSLICIGFTTRSISNVGEILTKMACRLRNSSYWPILNLHAILLGIPPWGITACNLQVFLFHK